jgi:hypothetical protein
MDTSSQQTAGYNPPAMPTSLPHSTSSALAAPQSSLPHSYHYPPPVHVIDNDPNSSLMSPSSAPIIDQNSSVGLPATNVISSNASSTNYYGNSINSPAVALFPPVSVSDNVFPASSPSSSLTPFHYQAPLPTTAHAAQPSPRAFFSTDEGPVAYSKPSTSYSTSQPQTQLPQMIQSMPPIPPSNIHSTPASQLPSPHPHYPPPSLSINNDVPPYLPPQN